MIPLYGFLEGDTVGVLLLAEEHTSLAELAERLQHSARLRVARKAHVSIVHAGRPLDPRLTVKQANLTALERIDVVERAS